MEGDSDKGRVITGSSNFTEAGLQDNLEFNVELKNRSDYDFALAKFNELWAKCRGCHQRLRHDHRSQIALRAIHALRTLPQISLRVFPGRTEPARRN